MSRAGLDELQLVAMRCCQMNPLKIWSTIIDTTFFSWLLVVEKYTYISGCPLAVTSSTYASLYSVFIQLLKYKKIFFCPLRSLDYNDVKLGAMASQITSLTIVYSTVYSRRRSKKTSNLRVTGLCAGNSPVSIEFPHKWPVTPKMFPFDDIIMVLTTSDTSEGKIGIKTNLHFSVDLPRTL